MSGHRGRGASPKVQAALGWNGVATSATAAEKASCPEKDCSGELRFFTGGYGQTLEQCTNRRCVNHTPHRPQPDLIGPRKGARSRREDA